MLLIHGFALFGWLVDDKIVDYDGFGMVMDVG